MRGARASTDLGEARAPSRGVVGAAWKALGWGQPCNGSSLSFVYDNDNLLTTAGGQTVVPDLVNGLSHTSGLGAVTDSYVADGNGLFGSYAATTGSTAYSGVT